MDEPQTEVWERMKLKKLRKEAAAAAREKEAAAAAREKAAAEHKAVAERSVSSASSSAASQDVSEDKAQDHYMEDEEMKAEADATEDTSNIDEEEPEDDMCADDTQLRLRFQELHQEDEEIDATEDTSNIDEEEPEDDMCADDTQLRLRFQELHQEDEEMKQVLPKKVEDDATHNTNNIDEKQPEDALFPDEDNYSWQDDHRWWMDPSDGTSCRMDANKAWHKVKDGDWHPDWDAWKYFREDVEPKQIINEDTGAEKYRQFVQVVLRTNPDLLRELRAPCLHGEDRVKQFLQTRSFDNPEFERVLRKMLADSPESDTTVQQADTTVQQADTPRLPTLVTLKETKVQKRIRKHRPGSKKNKLRRTRTAVDD